MAACMSHLLTRRTSSFSTRRWRKCQNLQRAAQMLTCSQREAERSGAPGRGAASWRPLAADEVREVAALEQLGFLFVQLEEAVTHSIPDGLNRKQNSRPVNSNSRSGCFSPTADVWILDWGIQRCSKTFQALSQNLKCEEPFWLFGFCDLII